MRGAPSAGCLRRACGPGRSSCAARTSQRSSTRARLLPLAGAPDDPERAQRRQTRERRVLDRRAAEDEPCVLARLGDEGEPGAEAAAWAAAEALARRELDRPRLELARAEERERELRAAGADEAGDAEDLARAEVEGHAVTPGADTPCTDMRTGVSASSRTRFWGNVAVSDRPSIASTSEDSVSSAVRDVRTSRPSRSTVTESASSSTSRRKCEMRRIVLPLRASERTISWRASVSFAASAAVGSSMTMSCASRESARRISTFC